MIRFLYRIFRTRFQDLMVEEFLYSIPDRVTDPALTMLKDHRHKVERLINYQAYHLHRRMVADRKNSERYQGMLIQLALFMAMINQRVEQKREESAPQDDGWFQKAMDGLTTFKKKLSTGKREVAVK